jgi:predicted Zn-dependent protease
MSSLGHLRVRARLVLAYALLPVVAFALAGCNEDTIEKQIGKATAASVEATYAINHDPVLNDWNQDVGHTLTAFTTRQQVPYTFKVVDTDMVNAFAAPWGYVYITQGLLDFADSEDEVVAVVGHELGHVVHRDGIRSFKQSILFSLASALISSKSETLGNVTAIGLGLLSLHYSREQEYAADDHGTAVAYAAGYNPQGLLGFFDKLHAEMEKGRSSSFMDAMLATHPYTPNRRLRQQAKPWVMLTTVPSAMRVGQGYLTRGQYGHALSVLNAVAAKEPDNPELALMLADALAGRGEQSDAKGRYLMVSAQTSTNYPGVAIAQMAANPVPRSVPPTADEQAQALALVDSAGTLVGTTQAAGVRLASARQAMTDQLKAARGDSAAAMDALEQLSQVEADLPKQSQQIVLKANAAVAAAADVMYTLDLCQELSAGSAQHNGEAGRQAKALLQSLSQGAGRSGVLPLVQNAMYELGKSDQLLQEASEGVRAAVGPCQAAQASALQTSAYVRRIFDQEQVKTSDLVLAQMLTEDTRAKVRAAVQPAQEAERQARLAATRGMLATLQLAQAQAPAEMLPGLDRMVAHYLRTTPGQIATLRNRGFGYGQIPVIVVAARGAATPLASEADLVAAGPAPLEVVQLKRDNANGLKVMVNFLSKAMAEEVGMLGKTAPAA